MKFLVAFAAVVAVAVARTVPVGPAGPTPVVGTPGIAVGPAILDFSPISVGPAILDFSPISVGPAITTIPSIEEPVAAPAPASVSAASPLVQIIVNVQKAEDVASVVAPSPVVMPSPAPVVEEVYVPGPVNVVDGPVDPIHVISPVIVEGPYVPGPVNVADGPVEPVQVANPVIVEPIQVGTPVLPTPVEPVQVATPIIPGHAINPIESLN